MKNTFVLVGLCLVGCGSASNDATDVTDDVDATPAVVCGDGVVAGDEECDDSGESAACNDDCTAAACGDGIVNATAGETCEGDTFCVACVATPATFAFTGAAETFTVPDGITALAITLTGAAGGGSASCVDGEMSQDDGGLGAVVTATLAVTPGEALTIRVGGKGGFTEVSGDNSPGGYNGGGDGGYYGGGGGGATDIRIGGDTLADRILVAGGGGGGNTGCPDTGYGGNSGEGGEDGNGDGQGQPPGLGGTASAGGAGGGSASAGALGVGGGTLAGFHVGGGGGGLYGGGGGYGSGGGGGSSFAALDATDVTFTVAAERTDGAVTISVP